MVMAVAVVMRMIVIVRVVMVVGVIVVVGVVMIVGMIMVVRVIVIVGMIVVLQMEVVVIMAVEMGFLLESHVLAFLLLPMNGDGHMGAVNTAFRSGLGGELHPRDVQVIHPLDKPLRIWMELQQRSGEHIPRRAHITFKIKCFHDSVRLLILGSLPTGKLRARPYRWLIILAR
jgi:hypothetical protein